MSNGAEYRIVFLFFFGPTSAAFGLWCFNRPVPSALVGPLRLLWIRITTPPALRTPPDQRQIIPIERRLPFTAVSLK